MLNYWLEVETKDGAILIKILIGDEIIMSKRLDYMFTNKGAICDNYIHDQAEFTHFVNALRNKQSYCFYFATNPDERMIYLSDTEIFTFKTNGKYCYTEINTIMDDKKLNQFATELEKINECITSNISDLSEHYKPTNMTESNSLLPEGVMM